MRKLVLIAACCFGGAALATAGADTPQTDVAMLAVGTVHEALFSVALSGDTGFTVGAGGDVRESTDAGKTWKAVKVPVAQTLLGVATNGSKAIAVGIKGTVLLRDAQGVWTAVQSGTDSRLLAVAINGSGTAAIVGAFGTLLESTDGGEHWESVAPKWADFSTDGAEPNLYGVNVGDDGAITVAGEFGTIIRSEDGGKTWESKHHGEATLFGLDLHKNGDGYAVGQDGTVLKTADHGQTWASVDIASKVNLLAVKLTSSGAVYATGMHEILAGNDDGKPWRLLQSELANGLWHTSVAAADGASSAIAVGQAGQILRLGK
ncbi:MAG TPA: YCF48-related protein [Rudaea sp.]|jgi:photosystem II stability/assembly factor-like uncharacterized protein|uniref:WD40/YVTN/BNR-like repeat-containing protein n=1 Tax=Rudaea sp. TaxID=2136325 RepID=UPI002F950708